jgi:hypothetical protein
MNTKYELPFFLELFSNASCPVPYIMLRQRNAEWLVLYASIIDLVQIYRSIYGHCSRWWSSTWKELLLQHNGIYYKVVLQRSEKQRDWLTRSFQYKIKSIITRRPLKPEWTEIKLILAIWHWRLADIARKQSYCFLCILFPFRLHSFGYGCCLLLILIYFLNKLLLYFPESIRVMSHLALWKIGERVFRGRSIRRKWDIVALLTFSIFDATCSCPCWKTYSYFN